MDGPAQENQNNAAGAVGGGGGNAENAPAEAAAAAAGQGNGDTGAIESEASSAENNGHSANADGRGIVAAGEGAATAPSSSRYPQRKRKPLLLSADSNSNSAAVLPADGGAGAGAALTDRQFEKLLARYEADGEAERAQKKLRLERGYGDDDYPYVPPAEGCPPLDSLPKEALQLVVEMLPTVRAVFNLAFQSKYMLSFVEERVSCNGAVVAAVWRALRGADCGIAFDPGLMILLVLFESSFSPPLCNLLVHAHIPSLQADIVVRAAVIGDALSSRKDSETKKTLRVLTKKVGNHSIHLPSPLRLLRLLCAKRCERGPNCFEYDLKTELSSAEGVARATYGSAALPFGLALCTTCRKDVGHNFNYYHQIWRNWDGKDRICTESWGSRVVNFNRCSDVLTTVKGENVGPIIEAKDICRISASHSEATARQDAYNQLLIDDCYGEEDGEERTSYERSCNELVNLFDAADTEITTWLRNRQNEKQAEARAKHDENLAAKKENLKPILAALESSVADLPLKELALDYRHQDVSSEAVRFKYFFMRETMGALIKAPSSATPKVLAATLTAVKRKLTILSNSDTFFDLSFLTSVIEACTDSREKTVLQKLLDQARTYVPSMTSLLFDSNYQSQVSLNNTNDRFFDLLEQQEFTTALLHTMEARDSLKWVASSVLVSSTSSDVNNHKRLARAVFLKVEKERPRGTDGTLPGYTLSSFQSTLTDVRRDFRLLKTRANAYLNHQPVKDWVEGNEHQAQSRYRRQEAVNNAWYPRAAVLNLRYNNHLIPNDVRGVTPYNLLMNQDFDRLLSIHRFYFNWYGTHASHYDPEA